MSDLDGCQHAADALTNRYLKLLDENLPEQRYQQFLEEHTQLIPREFVQNHGVHFSLVLRKLRFGADYVSDFFFLSKSSDDWNLVFIEIEKPSSRFFRDNSNDFHPDFQHALEQINRWRAWLSNPDNLASLISNTLAPVYLPLSRNPGFPKFVLVHGRRAEYAQNQIRRGLIRSQEREDFKILTFDSLVEHVAYKHECYIGVRYNERIHIRGNKIVAPEIWGWIEPSLFSVDSELQALLKAGQTKGPWVRRFDRNNGMVPAFEYAAESILVRPDESDAPRED